MAVELRRESAHNAVDVVPETPTLPQHHHVETSSTVDAPDFDFRVDPREISVDNHSTADELFSDGKILPIPIHRKSRDSSSSAPDGLRDPTRSPLLSLPRTVSGRRREAMSQPYVAEEEEEEEEEEDDQKPRPVRPKAPSLLGRFGRSSSQRVGRSDGGIFSSLRIVSKTKSTSSNLLPEYQRQTSVATTRGRTTNSCSSTDWFNKSKDTHGSCTDSSSSFSSGSPYYRSSSKCRGVVDGAPIRPVLNFTPVRSGNGSFLAHLLCIGRERSSGNKHTPE